MDENENVTDQGASAKPTAKVKGVKRNTDKTLSWVRRDYPQLAAWRDLTVLWLEGETTGIAQRLRAFVSFFERYLVQQRLPLDPAVLLGSVRKPKKYDFL